MTKGKLLDLAYLKGFDIRFFPGTPVRLSATNQDWTLHCDISAGAGGTFHVDTVIAKGGGARYFIHSSQFTKVTEAYNDVAKQIEPFDFRKNDELV